MPLGLAKWFKGVGVQNVHEMGWWQEAKVPQSSITLACVPAQVLSVILIVMVVGLQWSGNNFISK